MIRLRRHPEGGYSLVANTYLQQHPVPQPPNKVLKVQRHMANYWDNINAHMSIHQQAKSANVLLNASAAGNHQKQKFPYTGPFLLKFNEGVVDYPTVIPNYSSWFDFEKVHENEKRALPEFFANEKITEEYMKYRNVMVKSFRSNPRVCLSSTACRKLIAADACSLLRIHNFLESWGLINYMVDPGSLPVTSTIPEASDSHFPVYTHSATIGGLRKLKAARAENKMDIDDSKEEFDFEDVLNLPSVDYGMRSSVVSGSTWKGYPLPLKKDDQKEKCNMCGTDLLGDYHVSKGGSKASVGILRICRNCFSAGNFPVYLSSDDFASKNASKKEEEAQTGGWSKEESLKLLDGLERFGEDWDRIAQYVGKTKAECVYYFVKMPIEDPYIEQYYNPLGLPHNLKDEGWLPFADTSNPIMAQIAFLSSMVSPVVAASAAQTAMARIADKKQKEAAQSRTVKTEYGIGEVVSSSPDDRVIVKLPWSTVTLCSNDVSDVQPEDLPLNLKHEDLTEIAQDTFVTAVMKAEELSDKEFRQMVTAVIELIQLEMKKIELKMKHFEQMELVLSREKDHLEKCRQSLLEDRSGE